LAAQRKLQKTGMEAQCCQTSTRIAPEPKPWIHAEHAGANGDGVCGADPGAVYITSADGIRSLGMPRTTVSRSFSPAKEKFCEVRPATKVPKLGLNVTERCWTWASRSVPLSSFLRWEPGTIVVFDRGDIHYEWFVELIRQGVWAHRSMTVAFRLSSLFSKRNLRRPLWANCSQRSSSSKNTV